MKIGFIGQGWIGKNYADNFEERGYEVVRYDIDKYKQNKEQIKECDFVFVAVPTPSITIRGYDYTSFDYSILYNAIKSATKENQIIIIKSTITLGTTEILQKDFPDRFIIHSPEFLTEATAKYDAANPSMNIVGYTDISKKVAGRVLRILPCAPFEEITECKNSEMLKYMINSWFYMKVLTTNLFYDVIKEKGLDYEFLKTAFGADKRVGKTHLDALHKSGRGAGGHCFIKDFAEFRSIYSKYGSELGDDLLHAAEEYNKKLLKDSKKDLDLLSGVYDVKN